MEPGQVRKHFGLGRDVCPTDRGFAALHGWPQESRVPKLKKRVGERDNERNNARLCQTRRASWPQVQLFKSMRDNRSLSHSSFFTSAFSTSLALNYSKNTTHLGCTNSQIFWPCSWTMKLLQMSQCKPVPCVACSSPAPTHSCKSALLAMPLCQLPPIRGRSRSASTSLPRALSRRGSATRSEREAGGITRVLATVPLLQKEKVEMGVYARLNE